MARKTKDSADYGLDAPGVVRWLVFGGGIALVVGLAFLTGEIGKEWKAQSALAEILCEAGIGCLASGLWMLGSSYYGKFRVRDRLLRQLHLRGDEVVLDVGCGHGLLLIGAAKLLPRGRAVGIDLWSQVDQSNNSRENTLRNSAIEGVAGRVEVHDGDMRRLPFAEGSFDAVVAHFAIHNIPSREGRREAIREVVRVLKAGGQVALSDLKSVGVYADELRKSGMNGVKVSMPSFWTWPPSRTTVAHKPSRMAQFAGSGRFHPEGESSRRKE
ncbi:MAG: class I SAM-dependent methyltransferase [Candidatus Acidiferrales bacterium]